MVSQGQPEVLRFGVFELNLPARELRKYGVRIRLTGQPFDLLCLLLERHGVVVTRDEMRNRLWPGGCPRRFRAQPQHRDQEAPQRVERFAGKSRLYRVHARVGYRFIASTSGRSAARPLRKQLFRK